MKKEIIVGVLINPPQIFIDVDGKMKGILIEIWDLITNKLSNKYIFKYIILNQNNYRDLVSPLIKLQKNKYDILIGSYWINNLKGADVIFTLPLILSSPLIIYNNSISKEINYRNYAKSLIKIWYKPLLVIFFFLILIDIYKRVKNIKHSFINSLELFFSEKNLIGLEDDYILIFVLIIKFFLFVFIFSVVVSKTIEYYYKSNEIENDIEGKKIFSQKEDAFLVKSHGGIPLIVNNPLEYYQKDQYKKNVIGYVDSSLSVNKTLNKYRYLRISNAIRSINQIIFPLNKKNKELLKEINLIVFDINNKGLSHKFCDNININNNEINC